MALSVDVVLIYTDIFYIYFYFTLAFLNCFFLLPFWSFFPFALLLSWHSALVLLSVLCFSLVSNWWVSLLLSSVRQVALL